MLLRRFTDIYPKELARDMREFFNSLLGASQSIEARAPMLASVAAKSSAMAELPGSC